jgi:hypothetical protein
MTIAATPIHYSIPPFSRIISPQRSKFSGADIAYYSQIFLNSNVVNLLAGKYDAQENLF